METQTSSPINHRVEVNLLGQKLVLKTAEQNSAEFQAIIDLAKRKLEEAQSRAKNAPLHQVAFLALLDLAEEYIRAKNSTENFQAGINEKASELFRLIEAEFSE